MKTDPRILAKNANWYGRNRVARNSKQAQYNQENRAEVNRRARVRSKRPEVKAKRNVRQKARHREDIAFRLYTSVRTRLNRLAKRKCSQRSALRTIEILGCSMLEFRLYIERQFKRGMSWENYGNVWQLDHKIPCAHFDLSNPDHVRRCFNFRNYQPLWTLENLSKRHVLKQPTQIALGL